MLASSAFCLGLVGILACTDQGEGERCDVRMDQTGESDCKAALVCIPEGQLNIPAGGTALANQGRCCPPDRRTASVSECLPVQATNLGDAAVPTSDASNDASNDGASSTDSAVDASASDGGSNVDSGGSQDGAQGG
jgi:hypothetical protein